MTPRTLLGSVVARPRPSLYAAVLALTAAACGSSTGSGLDGPVMRYPNQSGSGDGMAAEIRGVLEQDGDCLYVSLDEIGERYPILWPAGTAWDAEAAAVLITVA